MVAFREIKYKDYTEEFTRIDGEYLFVPEHRTSIIFKDGYREISLNELVSAMEEILGRDIGKKNE